jgi:D-arabinono-1,4-lactone oxidase
MKLLNKMFIAGKIKATTYYSTEIYAGKKSTYWLSPAYERDVIRVDFFWFRNNEGDPGIAGGFFSQFWDELKKENIPFRVHWAKFLPEYDYENWAEYFRSQYPRWDAFMALRKERDPQNIFLTDYWSLHLFGKKKAELTVG